MMTACSNGLLSGLSIDPQHVWTVRDENDGGQSVRCARCMVPMDVRRLLQAYVDKHGGQIR